MSTFPRSPAKIWTDLNMKYFGGTLPPVTFRYVEDFSEGFIIDTRSDLAAVLKTDDGWQVELNQVLEDLDARFLYLTIAHEAVHIKCPGKKHGSKEWNSEVRRLQGLGLFLRIF